MSRPRPLVNLSSAVTTEYHQLTPRTPRTASGSRTSQLEEGFAEVRLTEATEADLDDDPSTLQSAPLLASSSTRFFARDQRSSANVKDTRNQLSRSIWAVATSVVPLVAGILIGGLLLFMLVLSLTRPGSLHRYFGLKPPPAPSTQHAGHIAHQSPNKSTIPPLRPIEYLKVCGKMHADFVHHGDYWDHDIGPDMHTVANETSIDCSRTITYMLDGSVGISADLALLAQAAALARERNRTFLVDDTYWNRGKWTDHFEDIRKLQPGPQPGCEPPPGNELVPCPRTARHWVITSRTAKFHFGDGFSNHYEDAYAHNLNRLKPIFLSAWKSFASTILPTSSNRALIKLARQSFSSFLHDRHERGTTSRRPFVSTHIRRGDRQTLSYSFPDRKIPIQNYVDAIEPVWSRLHHSNALPAVYLATDSPEAHEEFVQSYQGAVFSLFTTPDSRLRPLASPGEYYQKRFDELDLQTRITATRGMIVDLAVLSGLWPDEEELVPDAMICALSSNICRLAPIGMGWDMAFGHVDEFGNIGKEGRWIDVDEQGRIIPVWGAFELF